MTDSLKSHLSCLPTGGSEVSDRAVPRQAGLSAGGRGQRAEQRTQTAAVSRPLHPQQGPHPAAGRAFCLPRPHVSIKDKTHTLLQSKVKPVFCMAQLPNSI